MQRLKFTPFALSVVAALMATSALAGAADLVGRWKNVNQTWPGTAYVEIRNGNDGLYIHVWQILQSGGPGDQGEWPVQLFSPNVSTAYDNAESFISDVRYKREGMHKLILGDLIRMPNGAAPVLGLRSFTEIGRGNFVISERFVREP